MALFNFNASEHNAMQSFDVLPKGWYQVKLIDSEAANTNGGGQMLKFTAEVLAPQWAAGRKVFLRYNVVNANEDTVRIGKEHLAAMSIACGLPQWGNTEQLHEKPFHLKLKVVKGNLNKQTGEYYDDSNDGAGYDQIGVNRALAKQDTAPAAGGTPSAPFAVGAAPVSVAQPQAPVQAPTAPFPGGTPVQQAPAQQAPVQQTVQQPIQAPVQQVAPVQQAPVQQVQQAPAQVQQPWAAAPQQPWEQPQQQVATAPVQQAPVQQPEMVQQTVQQPVQQAPVQQVVQQPVQQAPVEQPAAQPWQTQTVQPQQPAAQQAPAQAAPVEQPHPAQAEVPPWQVQAQPTA